MCESAALELGESFVSGDIDNDKVPAGCYFQPASINILLGRHLSFNKIIDASSTKSEEFDGRAGVCKAGMDSSIALLYFENKFDCLVY